LGASSTYRIIQGVNLFPYKIQMQQALHKVNKARRADFCDDQDIFGKETSSTLNYIV
jgi:hypothetical protein